MGRNSPGAESERCGCLLERLGQKEALLHVVVRRVGGVDVLHAGEAPAHPAVLVDGLQGVTREAEEGGWGEERQRNKWRASDKWTTKTKSNEMKRADTKYRRWVVGAGEGYGGGGGGGGVWDAQIFNKLSKVCSN